MRTSGTRLFFTLTLLYFILVFCTACAPADASIVVDGSPEAEDTAVCSLTIRCDTVLENLADLTEGKAELIPADGLLLSIEEAAFRDGESVFDVLKRELQSRRIHLEFSETPISGLVYIEGIFNLYEFDCGDLSGWVYRVNGEVQSLACSEYILSDGDTVEVLYTCDLGDDL